MGGPPCAAPHVTKCRHVAHEAIGTGEPDC